ncbi:MAG: AAA family ATPase [Nitrospirae bacterium]|nr:AAA family ATPase [Nitrospirota bacterium]OIP61384.1 MAG: hypothetical protein AUK38_00910 [Nitrospirae bacterium CG2_30_41_42]PIQ94594.1 MAG: hypothetical protein COV68_03825 [Nitrospirae bacterium CG11_big_fil_rev_8_21_14_0_20_41_14]PIV41293.1 MAG: hypothetical protein COS27_10055 [Nitrospirae bacterium CG02_land_8_20_14_3_00_41_53]PIW87680.1 MAG: hypothetical protein COZ94_03745 [Nitrospirae bacterium CG_4_8_14_3_um_filter_41_47]
MKITYLKVENVRCIDSAEFQDLGNIILIVGPNGSGKSALFEAIRVFKTSMASYSTRWGINLSSLYPNFVSLGKDRASITLEVGLTKEEQEALNTEKDVLKSTITVDKNLSVTPAGDDINLFRQLFSPAIFSKYNVGKFEHIPSDRRFGKGQISSISFSQDLIEQDRHRMFDDTSEKFTNLKSDLLWMHMVDLHLQASNKHIEPHPQYIEGVKKIFTHFLDGVEFEGVDLDVYLTRPANFIVKTPRGPHDIDALSSGQREILMTYALLEKRKFTNSVILFDEPELHLHGALERRVLSYLQGVADIGNQFWIGTHSPEIIGSCEKEIIYRLTGGNPNIAERVDLKSEKIETLKSLGASVHIQMISQRIVYVEGESDSQILEYINPNIVHSASFIPSQGVRGVRGAIDLLNKASRFENFRGIRDRDYLSDEEIGRIESETIGRIHVWERYHIENYLLDGKAIYNVLSTHKGIKLLKIFNSPEEINKELKLIADGLKNIIVAKKLENLINEKIVHHIKIDPKNIKESYKTIADRRLPDILSLLEEKEHDKYIKQAFNEIDNQWEQKWVELCPGREILKEFCRKNIDGALNTIYPILVEQIAKQLAADGLNAEVKSVIEKIIE